MKLFLLFLVIASVAYVPCKAHLAYNSYCCGGEDCGVIKNIVILKNGDKLITITVQYGEERSAIFSKDHISGPPIDDKDHACIYNSRPRCLFLNGGV